VPVDNVKVVPAYKEEVPDNPADTEKTAFCPESFGLTSALSSFQQLMGKTLNGIPFVTIYLDDI